MRSVRMSFLQFLSSIKHDMMLFASCTAPLLAGLAIRFGIPALEKLLTGWLELPAVLTPYYDIFTMFFSMLSPVMLCFVAAMVILEERDDRISSYLFITPLGKSGYLITRFGIPAVLSFIATLVLLPLFQISGLSFPELLLLSFGGTLQGVIVSLLIITISSNKLEGMAVTKMSTLIVLGIVVPYFIKSPMQYLLAFLPSFWIGKAIYESLPLFMLPAIFLSFVWIFLLLHRYQKKR